MEATQTMQRKLARPVYEWGFKTIYLTRKTWRTALSQLPLSRKKETPAQLLLEDTNSSTAGEKQRKSRLASLEDKKSEDPT